MARLQLITRHSQEWLLSCLERVDWRVEWCTVVFSHESDFCLLASYGLIRVRRRLGERNLPESIHPRQTGPNPRLDVLGLPVTIRGRIGCLYRINYSLPSAFHSLLTPFYCHFFDRKATCFSAVQSTCTYGCCDATCSLCCRTTALSSNIQLDTCWTMMMQGIPLSPYPTIPLPNCDNGYKMLGKFYCRIGTLMVICLNCG